MAEWLAALAKPQAPTQRSRPLSPRNQVVRTCVLRPRACLWALILAPRLSPNAYRFHIYIYICKRGARRTDPTRVKGAHNKGP